jgi:hypothetical protein
MPCGIVGLDGHVDDMPTLDWRSHTMHDGMHAQMGCIGGGAEGVHVRVHLGMLGSGTTTGASEMLGGSGESEAVGVGAGSCLFKVEKVGIAKGSPSSC